MPCDTDCKRFGEVLDKANIPICSHDSILVKTPDRMVYYASNNETPEDIADICSVDVECLLYHNWVQYPTIEPTSRLKPLTPSVAMS